MKFNLLDAMKAAWQCRQEAKLNPEFADTLTAAADAIEDDYGCNQPPDPHDDGSRCWGCGGEIGNEGVHYCADGPVTS